MLLQVAPDPGESAAQLSEQAEVWQLWLAQADGSAARSLGALPPVNAGAYSMVDQGRPYLVSVASSMRHCYDITDPDQPQPASSLPLRWNVWRVR